MPGILVAVIVGLAVCQLAIFLTTIFLHRALAHRALTMSPGLRLTCRVLVWITVGIQPRQWVAVHRKHHAFTDVEGDPHSPLLEGFAKVQLGNVLLYRRAAKDGVTVERYAKDLAPDAWDRALFDHALLGLGAGIGLLFLAFWGNWRLVAIAAGTHVVSYLLLNSAVNAVGHRFGSRPFPGLAANSQWLAWLTGGEGLHSNHHAAPTSARLAMRGREIDPGWWLIALGRKLRWLTVRHEVPRITQRARHTPQLV
ncbi:MAG TPA: fatty acid desaturase [Candidatus Dormibacteraeota bacterium]|nr:fatty acid desaturase [Candidatus Dormibacteraeota bacterium]